VQRGWKYIPLARTTTEKLQFPAKLRVDPRNMKLAMGRRLERCLDREMSVTDA